MSRKTATQQDVEQVGKPTTLVSRGRVWYYRQRVPADLIEVLRKREFSRSLKTGDYREALRRHGHASTEFRLLIEFERQKLRGSSTTRTPFSETSSAQTDDAGLAYRLVKDWVSKYRATAENMTRPEAELGGGDADLIEAELHSRVTDLLDLENVDGAQSVYSVASRLERERPEAANKTSSFGDELRQQVRLALLEVAEENLSTFEGRSPRTGHLRFSSQPAPSTSLRAAASQYRAHELDVKPGTPRTRKKRVVTLDFVVRHFGLDKSIEGVTRADAIEFRNLMAKAPSNATKVFGNLSLRELVEMETHPSYRVMAYNTQKTYLETAERFFEWAVEERIIDLNPMRKLRSISEKTPAEEQRNSYTDDELNRIFAAPIYTGSVNDTRQFAVPGPNIIKRSRFWLPLIALFTGARPEEILQLTPAHIQSTENGVPFFAITRDMKLKTGSAVRQIPIHPTLQAAGFLTFVDTKRTAGAELLFSDVAIGSDGTRSGIWSKRYSSFSHSVKVKSHKNCFYSFRHTFKDAVRAAAIPLEQANRLQGWSTNGESTGSRYGSGYGADQLAEWMAKICYPKVQLSHLTEPRSPS